MVNIAAINSADTIGKLKKTNMFRFPKIKNILFVTGQKIKYKKNSFQSIGEDDLISVFSSRYCRCKSRHKSLWVLDFLPWGGF